MDKVVILISLTTMLELISELKASLRERFEDLTLYAW
jgi:hypothetical protein